MTEDARPSAPMQQTAAYRLTTSFPYLVRRVGVRIGELFEREIESFGVSVAMYRVLAVLCEQDGQRLGNLSRLTTIELSTLSRLIGAMTRKGLVTRSRPKDNGRIVEISLSARGRKLAEDLMPMAAHYDRVAISGLSDSDIGKLKSLLQIAYDNLDKLEAALEQRDAATKKPMQKPSRLTASASSDTPR